MTIDELRAWISARFWSSEQTAAWVERYFYRKKAHKQTGGTQGAGNLPIVTNADGYVDPSFYDLTAVQDDTFILVDNGDPTKRMQFQLSGIDTSTTRTLTVPNHSGTLATLGGDAQTWTSSQTFDERIEAPQGIRSGSFTLAQDTATSIPVPNNHAVLLIFNFTGGGGGYNGMCRVRAGASPNTYAIFDGANFGRTTGVLTGTTGAVNTLTVSPHTNGLCYIENRRPLTQTFDYTWL